MKPVPICFTLLRHVDFRAFSLALAKTGKELLVVIAIM